jgi:hypothetical protein
VFDGHIEKSSSGVGRKSWYALTHKARQQARMGTLDFKSEREQNQD